MFVRVNDLVVHCAVEGPPGAPALLMLHALGTSLHVWDPQAAALARQFRVIRPDMRGHGLTGITPGPYSMEQLARDALGVLDALGEKRPVHVAGLSIGGRIALELAAAEPERVASLILCDTALEFPPESLWHERAAAVRAEGMEAVADAVMARWVVDQTLPAAHGLRRMLLCTPPEGYAGAAEAIAAARAAPLAGRVLQPSTVIVGDQDTATPRELANQIRNAITGSNLVVIPDGAHVPTFEHAAAVTDALRAHLLPLPNDSAAEAGMAVRRAVLGDAHVDRALAAQTEFDQPFQEFIMESVWGRVWTRPGLPRHTRSLLTLGLMAALGHHEEFRLHVRATRNTGVTPAELSEVLLQVAAYAGVPCGNSALRIARETFQEMGEV